MRQQHDVTTEDGLMRFYDAAFDDVYRSAARLTRGDRSIAEDLVQEAFVRLIRAVRSGDVTVVSVGWLITTVRRVRIDGVRSREREERRLRVVASPALQPQSTGDVEVAGMLDGLSERERTAMVLRYIEDQSVGDVAELMGTSTRAMESLLQRAKRKARNKRGAS